MEISTIRISDARYPERLRNIHNPPDVLYINGNLPPVDAALVIGIVGTRDCTPYGYQNARRLGAELSQSGIIVATGLARGIDTAAAEGALEAGGTVIGVVGCGADVVYPPRNERLFAEVIGNGAVVSEYPPGTLAMTWNFPARNRIISGLSNGVAVIEAPEKSGALITAQYVAEQGRDLFVLPGNVDARACTGSNRLLRIGAIPFMNAQDIIEEYKELFGKRKKPIDNHPEVDYIDVDKLCRNLAADEKAIFKSIRHTPLFLDEIVAGTKINASTALASLTALELEGYVRRAVSGKWEITV